MKLCAIILLLASVALAEEEEMARLEKGEVILRLEAIPGSKAKKGVTLGVIDAGPDSVWTVITDYEHYKDFMPRGKKSDIIERDEKHVRYFSLINMPWPIADVSFEAAVELAADHRSLQFKMVPGTGTGVKSFEGSWELWPYSGDPKRTLAKYTLLFEQDRWYPQWAVDLGTKNTLGKILEAVRKRAKPAQP